MRRIGILEELAGCKNRGPSLEDQAVRTRIRQLGIEGGLLGGCISDVPVERISAGERGVSPRGSSLDDVRDRGRTRLQSIDGGRAEVSLEDGLDLGMRVPASMSLVERLWVLMQVQFFPLVRKSQSLVETHEFILQFVRLDQQFILKSWCM